MLWLSIAIDQQLMREREDGVRVLHNVTPFCFLLRFLRKTFGTMNNEPFTLLPSIIIVELYH